MSKLGSLVFLLLVLLLVQRPTALQAQIPNEMLCESVIVQEGDSLWEMARRFYGDPFLYSAIAEATNRQAESDNSYATIIDQRYLVPGWKVCVPTESDARNILNPESELPTELPDVIKIGAAQALSGPLATYGNPIRDGIELAVTQVNDSDYLGEATLEVVWKDTQGDPLQAIRAFDKLINEEQVVALIGPTLSNSAFTADWLAQQAGVPVISSSNTATGVTDIGSYIFSTALPDSAIIPNTIREAKNLLGLKRVAVIYDAQDAFTKSSYDLFTEALVQEGLMLVATEPFRTGEIDFSEQLTKIRDEKPDAIVVSALAVEAAEIMKQAHQLGIPASVRFIGGNGFNTLGLFDLAGEAANGAISGAAWHISNRFSINEQFVADFNEAYDRDPDQFAAQAYTAVFALATAIRDANSIDPPAVRDALDTMGVIESPLGPFTFDDNREPVQATVVQLIDNGEFVLLASSPTPPHPDEVIKIGAAHALSGPAALYSQPIRNGINLAIKEVNESGLLGRAVLEVIWEDTEGTPQQATQAFYKLINEDEVVAILGPTHSSSAFAAGLLAQRAGVPVIASSIAPGIADIGDYIFRTSLPENVVIGNTIKVSKEQLGLQEVVVIFDKGDVFTTLDRDLFLASLEAENVEVIALESFHTGDTNFSEQLTEIKELKPDAVIVVALPQQGPQILRQARELGIPPDVRFIGGSGFNSAEVIKQLGQAADGLISGAAWNLESKHEESQKFVEAYREEYGANSDPDSFAAQAYTAGWVLAHAIRNAKNEGKDPTDPTVIRNALDNLGVIDSPMGDFRFKEREPHHNLVVQVAHNGKWVPIEEIVGVLPTDLPSSIKVGVAHDLSGPAAAYGNSIRQGIELAVEQINENKKLGTTTDGEAVALEVILQDTAGDKDQAKDMFNKLVNEDEVVAILGPTLSNSAFVADPLAQEAGVPVIASSNTATEITDIGDYIFRTSLPESLVIPNTIKEMKASLGVQKVAVIYDEADDFTESSYDVFDLVLREEGLEIVTIETFTTGDTDFSAQLTKIKELNPEAIVVSALASEAAKILKQARELGIPKSVRFIGGNGFNSAELLELAGEAANGAISGAAWNIESTYPASQDFVSAYRAKYGEDPDQFAAQAYTAVLVLAEALRNANSVERDALRDALAALDEENKIDSPLGLFYFDENRDPVHRSVVQVIYNGELAPLE